MGLLFLYKIYHYLSFYRGYSLIGKTLNLHFGILGSIPNISKTHEKFLAQVCLLIFAWRNNTKPEKLNR